MSVMTPHLNSRIRSIWAQVLYDDAQTWKCASCGHEGNSGISEICEGCNQEDCGDLRDMSQTSGAFPQLKTGGKVIMGKGKSGKGGKKGC